MNFKVYYMGQRFDRVLKDLRCRLWRTSRDTDLYFLNCGRRKVSIAKMRREYLKQFFAFLDTNKVWRYLGALDIVHNLCFEMYAIKSVD